MMVKLKGDKSVVSKSDKTTKAADLSVQLEKPRNSYRRKKRPTSEPWPTIKICLTVLTKIKFA